MTTAAKILATSIAIGWIGLAPAAAGSWAYKESKSGNPADHIGRNQQLPAAAQ